MMIIKSIISLMIACALTTSVMPAASNQSFGKKEKALCAAAKTGDSKHLQKLITKKAHINARDETGRTALHHAADCGHIEIVRLLITAKANVYALDKYHLTPLNLAAFHRHKAIVELLEVAALSQYAANPTQD
ncbi:ankyrin repeat domain-containing protein [Candidatus Babeliales bacterium]|nr:ankyrin repeat domain-containing protein [Candidatus Babeliales bacterium]